MDAENKESYSQKNSAEHEGYVRAHRSFCFWYCQYWTWLFCPKPRYESINL